MAFGTTTYSGMGVTGAINSPYAGPFILAGAFLGRGKVTVTMEHEWTENDISVDGAVMVSASIGFQGMVEIECQQTSSLNSYLKAAQNSHQTALANMDPSQWAAISLEFQNLTTNDMSVCTGVSFTKKPPLPMGPKGEYIRWTLRAANIANL
jgi:hypothetical protein